MQCWNTQIKYYANSTSATADCLCDDHQKGITKTHRNGLFITLLSIGISAYFHCVSAYAGWNMYQLCVNKIASTKSHSHSQLICVPMECAIPTCLYCWFARETIDRAHTNTFTRKKNWPNNDRAYEKNKKINQFDFYTQQTFKMARPKNFRQSKMDCCSLQHSNFVSLLTNTSIIYFGYVSLPRRARVCV